MPEADQATLDFGVGGEGAGLGDPLGAETVFPDLIFLSGIGLRLFPGRNIVGTKIHRPVREEYGGFGVGVIRSRVGFVGMVALRG